MNSRLAELARRKAELIARSDAQRAQLGYFHQQFLQPVLLAESALRFTRSLWRSPLAVTGVTFVLMKTPWRKLARVPKLVWRGWRIVRFARGFLK